MTHITRFDIGGRIARWSRPAALFGASTLLAVGTQAQTPACEQLKATLASRIPPEIRGYSMEGVPNDAAVPAGAKAIGTCGAYKILYRRFGSSPQSAAEAGSAPPAPTQPVPTPPIAVASDAQSKRPPVTQAEPATARPVPAPPPASTPGSAPPGPQPVARASVLRGPAPFVGPPPPPPEAEHPATTLSSNAVLARATEGAPPEPARPAPTGMSPPDEVPRAKEPATADGPDFWSENWPWIAGLLALPLVAWAAMWIWHRRTYDEAGLPRGPRL